jgi:hypothetical protein
MIENFVIRSLYKMAVKKKGRLQPGMKRKQKNQIRNKSYNGKVHMNGRTTLTTKWTMRALAF